ncbi:MAG: septal ring lytic transglycosylase RlpA family protein [Gammaproteobacteria bacterium]
MSGLKTSYYAFPLALLTTLVGFSPEPTADRGAKPQATVTRAKKEPAFEQVGTASWYGPGFHGKKTANGEIYNQNKLTAAHRTLPLGAEVEVTNVTNGKAVEVKINDRGPYVGGRVIDLSRAAAIELGMKEQGVAKVKIEADSVAKQG